MFKAQETPEVGGETLGAHQILLFPALSLARKRKKKQYMGTGGEKMKS